MFQHTYIHTKKDNKSFPFSRDSLNAEKEVTSGASLFSGIGPATVASSSTTTGKKKQQSKIETITIKRVLPSRDPWLAMLSSVQSGEICSKQDNMALYCCCWSKAKFGTTRRNKTKKRGWNGPKNDRKWNRSLFWLITGNIMGDCVGGTWVWYRKDW